MTNNQFSKRRIMLSFMKKYGYIILLGVAILALTLTLLLIDNGGVVDDQGADVGGQTIIEFTSPVLDATVAKEFSSSTLMYNSTLNHWEAHKSIDFQAAEGANVYACFEGKVTEVFSDYLRGTVIVVEHADNLKTVYGSLQEDIAVKVGDNVAKGAVIGKVGKTANGEANLGAHLNFQVLQNGSKIDPASYLDLGNK